MRVILTVQNQQFHQHFIRRFLAVRRAFFFPGESSLGKKEEEKGKKGGKQYKIHQPGISRYSSGSFKEDILKEKNSKNGNNEKEEKKLAYTWKEIFHHYFG